MVQKTQERMHEHLFCNSDKYFAVEMLGPVKLLKREQKDVNRIGVERQDNFLTIAFSDAPIQHTAAN